MKKIIVIFILLLLPYFVLADSVVVEDITLKKPDVSYSCMTDGECIIILNATAKCVDKICYLRVENYTASKPVQPVQLSSDAIFLLLVFLFVVIATRREINDFLIENNIIKSDREYSVYGVGGRVSNVKKYQKPYKVNGIRFDLKKLDLKKRIGKNVDDLLESLKGR